MNDLYFAILNLDCEYKTITFCFCNILKTPCGRFTTLKMTNIGVKTIKYLLKSNEYNSIIIDNYMENKFFLWTLKILEITKASLTDTLWR